MEDCDEKGTNRKMDLVQNVSSLNGKQQLQGVRIRGLKLRRVWEKEVSKVPIKDKVLNSITWPASSILLLECSFKPWMITHNGLEGLTNRTHLNSLSCKVKENCMAFWIQKNEYDQFMLLHEKISYLYKWSSTEFKM